MVSGGPFKVNLFKIDRQLQYDKFKIIQTLSTLSAFDTPTVSEWLINLRALMDHNLVLLLNNPVPTFAAYSEAHGVAISDIRHDDVAMATMTERFTMHTLAYDDVMAIVASIIIARVRWQYEPTLRTLVHGDPMAEDSTSRDGHGLYDALIRLADSSRAVVQDEYLREWAEITVCAEQGTASGVFAGAATYQQLLAAHDQQLRNYEAVAQHAALPAHPYVRTALRQIRAEVPTLEMWATEKTVRLAENSSLYATRQEFHAALQSLTPALMPSSVSLITSVRGGSATHDPVLSALSRGGPRGNDRGGDRRPFGFTQRQPFSGNPRPRPPFNACGYCDCRACSAREGDPMRLCGSCGDGVPKANATDEEKRFMAASKKIFKTDPKYSASPYMKGSEARNAIGATLTALAYDALDRDPDAGAQLALKSASPAPVVPSSLVPTSPYVVSAAPEAADDRTARLTAIADRLASDVSFDTDAVWEYLQGESQPTDQSFEADASGELKMLRAGRGFGTTAAAGKSPFLRTPPDATAPASSNAALRAQQSAPARVHDAVTPELPSSVRVHRKTHMLHTLASFQARGFGTLADWMHSMQPLPDSDRVLLQRNGITASHVADSCVHLRRGEVSCHDAASSRDDPHSRFSGGSACANELAAAAPTAPPPGLGLPRR